MAQQTTGRAALVANNLPSSKTVSTATNATPIVVTTSTNHGLQTNEIFTISGVTGNAAANGTFVAGAVTPTTVALLAYPGGTSVAGVGAGTGGTLQSLGFGITVPVPVDLTDAMRAGTINVPFEAVLDRLAYLSYQAGGSSSIFVRRAGDTMTGSLHMAQTISIIADGSGCTIAGQWSASGDWAYAAGKSVVCSGALTADGTSTFRSVGRTVPRAERVALTNADHTIGIGNTSGGGVEAGKRFVLANPSANRVITVKNTGGYVPLEAETLELVWMQVSASVSWTWQVKREDATLICTLIASATVDKVPVWAELEYVSGVWRLGATSGLAYDGTATYGVEADAGA